MVFVAVFCSSQGFSSGVADLGQEGLSAIPLPGSGILCLQENTLVFLKALDASFPGLLSPLRFWSLFGRDLL